MASAGNASRCGWQTPQSTSRLRPRNSANVVVPVPPERHNPYTFLAGVELKPTTRLATMYSLSSNEPVATLFRNSDGRPDVVVARYLDRETIQESTSSPPRSPQSALYQQADLTLPVDRVPEWAAGDINNMVFIWWAYFSL
jgi:hypothetical protein